jgi:hypothetical protein
MGAGHSYVPASLANLFEIGRRGFLIRHRNSVSNYNQAICY